jgi:hypothetical protein
MRVSKLQESLKTSLKIIFFLSVVGGCFFLVYMAITSDDKRNAHYRAVCAPAKYVDHFYYNHDLMLVCFDNNSYVIKKVE